jgi:hypothetical protein
MSSPWRIDAIAGASVLCLVVVQAACTSGTPTSEGSGSGSDGPEVYAPELAISIGEAFTEAAIRGTLVDVSEGWAEAMHGCPGLTHPSGMQRIELLQPTPIVLSVRPHGIGMMDLTLALIPESEGASDVTTVCVDDGQDTLNPEWSGLLPAGIYVLQVAADVATPVPYEITVRLQEPSVDSGSNQLGVRAPRAVVEGTQAESTDNGTFGGATLAPDFASLVLEGRSGGPRDATSLDSGCRGWIAEQPDHILSITETTDVVLWTDSPGDPTLVLQGPSFEHHCDDDTWGLQPVVSATLTAGEWAVFVGEYEPSQQYAYRLTLSRPSDN